MINKATLIGHTGSDPEIRQMPNGNSVANFSLATTESWKDASGQKQEKTTWHRLSVFGKLADVCQQWVHKGDKLYIEGRIDHQEYADKNTGEKKYSTQIIVNQMKMLGGGQQGSQASAPPQAAQTPPPSGPDFDDDIPF